MTKQLVLLAITLTLSGCGQVVIEPVKPTTQSPEPITPARTTGVVRSGGQNPPPNTWQPLTEGVSLLRYKPNPSKDLTITLYRFPADTIWSFKHDEAAPKSVSDWAKAIEGELLVTNGVYFHEDYSPSGLLVADGTRVGDRMFDADKSGLLTLEPKFAIMDTKMEPMPAIESLTEAGQSYPLLIKDGVAGVAEDSGLSARRTFVGTDREGTAYVGMVHEVPVTLYQLGQLLDGMEIDWKNVLNLDGGPSTGIVSSLPGGKTFDSFAAVPNVLVAMPGASVAQ